MSSPGTPPDGSPDPGPLYIDRQAPAVYRSMSATAKEVGAAAADAGLDRLLVELVNIRVSQINGCAFCLDLHVRRATTNGESAQRLAVLPAWRDVDLFSPVERAALALAETITRLPCNEELDRERLRARTSLTDDQFSAVCWLAVAMNAFNRISVISGHPVRARSD